MNKCHSRIVCNKCNQVGHNHKFCNNPITSWGIILVRGIPKYSKIDVLNNEAEIKSTKDYLALSECVNNIKFLIVRRKHSIGFAEFIRGKYIKDKCNGIVDLFKQMTPEEINKIKTMTFDELWNDFWYDDKKRSNKKCYLDAKEKFEALKNKIDVELPLSFYVDNVKPCHTTPEWGFPKGRKNKGETDIECAIREFCEETGYSLNDIKLNLDFGPIVENVVGTNGVKYKYIYYLAEDISDRVPNINEHNINEIGDIGFYTYEEVLNLFRDYHTEKREIVKKIFFYFLNLRLKENEEDTVLV